MGTHRRKKRAAAPVRLGLIGASAAVAMGAVAIASGLVPGADSFTGGSDKVESASSPSDLAKQGGAVKTPEREESAASRNSERPEPSSPSPSKSSAKPSAKPSPSKTPEKSGSDRAKEEAKTPPKEESVIPDKPSEVAQAPDTGAAAEGEVLSLVNKERARAGCGPVRADAKLADLAEAFSKDMAARGFFDHTDPDGDTPWDRAAAAGIDNLAGENIARGQANAQAVMDSWMKSPGHKSNILNCEYNTLGVGAHFASGGPWWTQDFGF